MKLVLTYIWTGVFFIWAGGCFLQAQYLETPGLTIAAWVSALVMFITAGQLSSLRRK